MMAFVKGRKMETFLIFTVIAAFLAVQGATLECPTQQKLTVIPLVISLSSEERHNVWIKPDEIAEKGNQEISMKFGKREPSGNFMEDYKLELKTKAKNSKLQYTFQKNSDNTKYIEGRIPLKWLNVHSWSRFSLTNSSLTFHFWMENQTLDIQLDGLMIDFVNEVQLSSNMAIVASTTCILPEETETTTTTTTPTTTTTTTTTTPTTTTTTTTPTTPAMPNTTTSPETTSLKTEVTGNTDIHSTQDPSLDAIPVAVREDGADEEECRRVPIWVWGCVGIMAACIVLFVMLLIYAVILTRRNRVLKASIYKRGDSLRGRLGSPGGYCQQARDLEYFKTINQNVVAISPQPNPASYTQTLRLPTGNSIAPDVRFSTAPRLSDYRRSTSCPGPRDPSPAISFPAPPSTPPPEARPETVPLYSPDGVGDDERRHHNREKRYSHRRTSSKRRTQNKEGIDADDESSLSN